MIIDYLINNYLISFIMCLLGSLLKDMVQNIQNSKKLNIRKIFISTLFSSFLAASILDYLTAKFSFPVVIMCCLIIGVWGFWLLQLVTRHDTFLLFISKIFKKVIPPEFIDENNDNKKTIDMNERIPMQIEDKQKTNDD